MSGQGAARVTARHQRARMAQRRVAAEDASCCSNWGAGESLDAGTGEPGAGARAGHENSCPQVRRQPAGEGYAEKVSIVVQRPWPNRQPLQRRLAYTPPTPTQRIRSRRSPSRTSLRGDSPPDTSRTHAGPAMPDFDLGAPNDSVFLTESPPTTGPDGAKVVHARNGLFGIAFA